MSCALLSVSVGALNNRTYSLSIICLILLSYILSLSVLSTRRRLGALCSLLFLTAHQSSSLTNQSTSHLLRRSAQRTSSSLIVSCSCSDRVIDHCRTGRGVSPPRSIDQSPFSCLFAAVASYHQLIATHSRTVLRCKQLAVDSGQRIIDIGGDARNNY